MCTLNKDCFGLVFCHLPLKEAVQNMLLSRITASLYNDDGFWHQYCLTRYHIDTKSPQIKKRPGTTSLAVAIEAEEMVRSLWEKRLFPPLRMLPYVFSLHPKKRHECCKHMRNEQKSFAHISTLTSTFWCGMDKEITIVQLCPDIPQLGLLPCPLIACDQFQIGTKVITTDETATNLRRIIKYVSVTTWYLTENGPIKLPIDIDRCAVLTPQLEAVNRPFSNMVGNQLWILVNQTCMQYLP